MVNILTGNKILAPTRFAGVARPGGAGCVDGTPLAGAGAFLLTGEAFIGRNISEYDYIGYHVGVNFLGISVQPGINEPIEAGVSPDGVSAGVAPFFEFEIGRDQDKPRDPTPPDRVP